jgi:CRP-like cAMP-binding protein
LVILRLVLGRALTWVKNMDFKNFISSHGKAVSKQKGAYVFSQGEVDCNIYFVKQGLLKAYYISDDGKEFVKSFLLPDSSIASVSSFHSKAPSPFSVVCLEASELVRISFDDLYTISATNNDVAMNVIDMLLQLAMKKERREYEFLCLSPEERYRQILDQQPELPKKITQNDLAGYLGITPIGLSRIKKRVNLTKTT